MYACVSVSFIFLTKYNTYIYGRYIIQYMINKISFSAHQTCLACLKLYKSNYSRQQTRAQ